MVPQKNSQSHRPTRQFAAPSSRRTVIPPPRLSAAPPHTFRLTHPANFATSEVMKSALTNWLKESTCLTGKCWWCMYPKRMARNGLTPREQRLLEMQPHAESLRSDD